MKNLLITFFLISSISVYSFSQTENSNNKFKDFRDGKEYKIIKIGDQIWMAENLAYNPQSNLYDNYGDELNNEVFYGYLYNWETSQTVCPVGWRLPNANDIKNLKNNIDIKEKQLYHAIIKDVSSGITFIPPAFFNEHYTSIDFAVYMISTEVIFWTSVCSIEKTKSLVIYLEGNNLDIGLYATDKSVLLPVRCIKD
ncbi:MAG: hypothetical protein K8R54_15800 [Bacteroidales bacterium]|nr:hypothetical protein [Bacteroidales bacterium]